LIKRPSKFSIPYPSRQGVQFTVEWGCCGLIVYPAPVQSTVQDNPVPCEALVRGSV